MSFARSLLIDQIVYGYRQPLRFVVPYGGHAGPIAIYPTHASQVARAPYDTYRVHGVPPFVGAAPDCLEHPQEHGQGGESRENAVLGRC